MIKVNLNNGNKIKSDIFSREIFKPDMIFHWKQILRYSMTFIFGIIQFHLKSEHKQIQKGHVQI